MITQTQLTSLLAVIQCCIADTACDKVVADQLNLDKKDCTKRKLYLSNLIFNQLIDYKFTGYQYENYMYTQTDDDQCLTEEQITNLIEKIKEICGCNCCDDASDLLKDI